MFNPSTSLPMRAAVASLLGSLFGVAMILTTQTAQAQAQTEPPAAASAPAAADVAAVIRRIGDATLRSLRDAEPTLSVGAPTERGLRLHNDSSSSSGLRWQVARLSGLRSEGDIPRNRDWVSVGVQVRF